MDVLPILSIDLITSLDALFPKVLPSPVTNREEELYKAGMRYVVDFLITLKNEGGQIS